MWLYLNHFYTNYAVNEDFIPGNNQLVFTQSERKQCVNAVIIDDKIYELKEIFYINITTDDPQVDITAQNTIVQILDNDGRWPLSLSCICIGEAFQWITLMNHFIQHHNNLCDLNHNFLLMDELRC